MDTRSAAPESAASKRNLIDFSVRRFRDKLKHAVAWSDDRQSTLLPKSYFLEYARREHLRALRTNSHLSVLVLSLDPATDPAPLELYHLSKTLPLLLRKRTSLVGTPKAPSPSFSPILTHMAPRSASREFCTRRLTFL